MNATTTRVMIGSLIAVAWLGGCGDFWPGKPKPVTDPVEASRIGFMNLYTENCSACHGHNGKLGAARPLNDPLYLSIMSKASFTKAVGHGQGILMPAYLVSEGGPMTEAELDTFVDDVYTYWGTSDDKNSNSSTPSYEGPGSSAEDVGPGGKAFATWCGACHGQDGKGLGDEKPIDGAVNGHSVVDEFYLRLISDQGIRSAVIFGHPEYGMPSYRGPFPGQKDKTLDEDSINEIVAWLLAQRVSVKTQAQEVNP